MRKDKRKIFSCPAQYFFPKGFWQEGYTFWWIISFVTVMMFDIFWMLQTTFRPFSYFVFWPVLFLYTFLLSFPSLFFKRGVIQTLWLLFFDLLFIANLMYCRTYYNAIPLQSYFLAGNLADFTSSVTQSFKWYFIFLPLLTICAIIFYTLKIKPKKIPRNRAFFIGYIALLGFLVWIGDAPRGGTKKRMEFMSNYAYLSSSVSTIYSIPGFLIYDYLKSNEKITPETSASVHDWLAEHEKFISPYWNDSIRINRKTPSNLVIILCESLENWVINLELEGKEITPNLNKWVTDSTTLYAPKVVTQVGSGRSIEGQLMVMTGLLPMRNKVYAYDYADNKFFSLAKAIKEKEGKAYLFTPDKPYVWNQARIASAFGLDSIIDSENFDINETTGRTKRLSDGSLMKQISQKLEKDYILKDSLPYFILTVTNSGHNPFDLPQHLRNITLHKEYPKIIKDYIITANYTDSSLKFLIDYLQSREDWEDTMVVITGDHEGLASDRKIALADPLSKEFVDPLQHTPLIILNSPVSGKYDFPIGQIDIYSTILDLMAWDGYKWKGMGFSLLDPSRPKFTFGSSGNLEGDSTEANSGLFHLMEQAKDVSDAIIKFDLLENY